MNSNKKIFLSIDLGTTGCKVLAFDKMGNQLKASNSGYPLLGEEKGAREQKPSDWWKEVKKNLNTVLKDAEFPKKDVEAIAITGQSPSILLTDESGNPIRPAILTYMDSRAQEYRSKVLEATEEDATFPEWMLYSNILWIRNHEPETYERAEKILDAREFVGYKLTGKMRWDSFVIRPKIKEKLNEKFDISDDLFPPAHTYRVSIGTITPSLSDSTGLKQETPVVIGPWDGMCNVLGSGLFEKGLAMDVAGTTGILSICLDPKSKAVTHRHLVEEKALYYTSEAYTLSHRWLKENIIEAFEESENGYELLDEMAEEAKDEDSPIFIPTIAGEVEKPYMKGAFFGIEDKHKLKNFARAVLEGTACYLRMMIEEVKAEGVDVKELRLSGGGSKSKVWNRIKANVTGKPVKVMGTPETGSLGAIMLAAVATKTYDDLTEAESKMVSAKEVIEPEPELKEKYDELYKFFKKCYNSLDEALSS